LKDKKPSVVGIAKSLNLFNTGDVFLASAETLGRSACILDFDCSFHMCSATEYFYTYQPCEKCIVNRATVYKVELLGWEQYEFICLMVVWIVTGVRDVPGLKEICFLWILLIQESTSIRLKMEL